MGVVAKVWEGCRLASRLPVRAAAGAAATAVERCHWQ